MEKLLLKNYPTPVVIGSVKVEVNSIESSKFGLYIMMNEFRENRDTLLLMHGYVGSSNDYAAAFNRFGSKHNLIAIDLRGPGLSEVPDDDWLIKNFVADIYSSVYTFIPENNKINIVGNSLLAAIALEFTIEYHYLVDKLFLISPSMEFDLTIWKKIAKFVLKPVPDFIIKHSIGMIGTLLPKIHRNKDYRELLKIGFHKLKSVDVSTHRMIIEKTLPSHSVNASQIDHRVLIIAGELDRLVPFKNSVHLNETLHDSSIVVLEKTKHHILSRRTQLVLDLLEQWLEMDDKILENKIYFERELITAKGGLQRLPITRDDTYSKSVIQKSSAI